MISSRERHPQVPSKLSPHSLDPGLRTSREEVSSHLAPNLSALGPQLVDLGLSDVGPLLSLLQLMLGPPASGQLCVGLFLLNRKQGKAEEAPYSGPEAPRLYGPLGNWGIRRAWALDSLMAEERKLSSPRVRMQTAPVSSVPCLPLELFETDPHPDSSQGT